MLTCVISVPLVAPDIKNSVISVFRQRISIERDTLRETNEELRCTQAQQDQLLLAGTVWLLIPHLECSLEPSYFSDLSGSLHSSVTLTENLGLQMVWNLNLFLLHSKVSNRKSKPW